MEFSTLKKSKVQDAPNLMPLIDVVFILLIFFLLTSTFRIDKGIEVNLPSSETAASRQEEALLTVSINGKGEVFVEPG